MYLVIETKSVQVHYPAYDFHDPPQGTYSWQDTEYVHRFKDESGLKSWIVTNPSAKYELFSAKSLKAVSSVSISLLE